MIERHGGKVFFVALNLSPDEQERRLAAQDRAAFGKLRDLPLLRALRPQFDACMAAMPEASLSLDSEALTPSASAEAISRLL
jgi:hypothetical protein